MTAPITDRSAALTELSQPHRFSAVTDRFPAGRRLTMSRIDAPSLTSVMSEYERDFCVTGEWVSDDTHYLDLSLSGRPPGAWGRFTEVSGELQRVGKLLFIPAGQRYSGRGGCGRQRSISVFLRTRPLLEEEHSLGVDLAPVLQHCLHLRSNALDELMLRIGRETSEPGFASELMLEGLGLSLFVEAARLLRTLQLERSHKGGLSAWRLRLIEDRVRSNGPQATLTELAKLCGLSRRHLIRAFREQTGQTLGTFVQRWNMQRAKTLLRETDRPVKLIAGELGFASQSSFATAFRRSCGQTPRQFRAKS